MRYVAVSAHKDDMEMFALGGIAAAYRDGGFAGVVLTDGGACPRAPRYAEVDDEDMAAIRTAEQKRAAETGRYEELCLFERSSDAVKEAAKAQGGLVDELAEVLSRYPRVEAAFVHNPFDEHPTHVAAFVTAIRAFSALPEEIRPERVYGCEVWRGLDCGGGWTGCPRAARWRSMSAERSPSPARSWTVSRVRMRSNAMTSRPWPGGRQTQLFIRVTRATRQANSYSRWM